MRPEGLEPSRLAALDPKSNVATNYTTAAIFTAKVSIYFYLRYIALLYSYNWGKYTTGESALSPLLPEGWARGRCLPLKRGSALQPKNEAGAMPVRHSPYCFNDFICRSVSSTPLYEVRTDARYSLLLTLYHVNGASTGIGFSICQLFNFPSVGVCCLRPKHRYVYC